MAEADELFTKKYTEYSADLEKKYEADTAELSEKYSQQLEEFKGKILSSSKNTDSFNSLLEKLFFPG